MHWRRFARRSRVLERQSSRVVSATLLIAVVSLLFSPLTVASAQTLSGTTRFPGRVVGWGDPLAGATPPAGLNNVIAISAGEYHSLALTADGTVVAWGANFAGQLNVPTGLSHVVAISAGGFHNLALKADGTVVGWGGENQSAFPCGAETPPAGLTGVIAISAGSFFSLALKANGTVVGWGCNLGKDVPSGLTGVIAISAGKNHSLALKADGTVVGWGGLEGANPPSPPAPPPGLGKVIAIAASFHSLALRTDGTVVGWGFNEYGEATPPAGLTNVVAIAVGDYNSLALKSDGTLVGWGGIKHPPFVDLTPPAGINHVTAIDSAVTHSLALIGPRVPRTLRDCVHGGWRDFTDEHLRRFRNQGACVRWIVTDRIQQLLGGRLFGPRIP